MAKHVCPWWMGYVLINPLRRFAENPDKILSSFIKPGMTVLDIGSAMGYFSIPAAKMTGPKGRVICVDLQQKMLDSLQKRARRKKLQDRIIPHKCSESSLELDAYANQVDFALAFHVVHEVPGPGLFFREVYAALKDGCLLFFSEPKGHVNDEAFEKSLRLAEAAGFKITDRPELKSNRTVVLQK